jgi:hypothetical protein
LDAANVKSYPGTGTTWSDLSGNGNNGTLTNGPTFDSNNVGSIVFDGVDDFAGLPYDSYWNENVFGTATNFSIECWYKPDLFMNWDTIIEKSESPGWYSRPEGASIWTNVSGFQGVFSSGVDSNPLGSYVIISYPTAILKWYHVCFTGDGTTLRLYVDGIQRATSAIANRSVEVYNGSVGPRFGRRAYMDGSLSIARFYTRGLSASEIQQNFEATRSRYGI